MIYYHIHSNQNTTTNKYSHDVNSQGTHSLTSTIYTKIIQIHMRIKLYYHSKLPHTHVNTDPSEYTMQVFLHAQCTHTHKTYSHGYIHTHTYVCTHMHEYAASFLFSYV